ncbi:MAG TPA: DNA mismatch repair protein MutS [candidate division Zixibacteria bacterium]|nr:DNA mismatch repair protein MutS [candidate division Zixibacteria bacterium]
METAKITPMMQQYLRIKERYRDAILFFRLGDFYEMFFEDAERASRILDIALTSRNKSEEAAVPLCGVPYHSAEPYIQKLLEAGHKVAVCEQVEDPRTARGVVQREVVRVITPGTVTAVESLDARGNNFLAAVFRREERFGLAAADITTGEFRCTGLAEEQSLLDEIARIRPSEILVADRDRPLRSRLQKAFPRAHLTAVPEASFSDGAARRLRSGSGPEALRAASAIESYLEANAPEALKVLREIEPYEASRYLVVDETTRANLELVASNRGERGGSLLGLIDRTVTPMGARRLRQWLLYPLLDVAAIEERQDAVQALVDDFDLRRDLRSALGGIQDLERLAGRVASGSASPKDLAAVKEALGRVAVLRRRLEGAPSRLLASIGSRLAELPDVVALLERAIVDQPPFSLKDGNTIREGFDAELDEIRGARAHAKQWIARFEAAERQRTGIASLKVRYNRVFGYYIEVTRANIKAVPPNYLRKQTLVNGERYITPELKEHEAKILNSESLIEKLEQALFAGVREQVASRYAELRATSGALGELDALVSLAEVALSRHFVRPKVDDGLALSIREGRHPVVEEAMGRGAFVPNDCRLDPETTQIVLLTGPNMAGKSTYMRQVALIVILAQMGSFVPASEAAIGLVDRVFTRIGAGDALAQGESTFMVEMKETANILRHATRRSLIVLDEVGRGTSTYDGVSIAWAVAEWLHDLDARPRTLFATHYHELADLPQSKERIKNYNFAVREWQGEIIFLRTLAEGASSRSYGIHVARLAGLPAPVIDRAREILRRLEATSEIPEPSGAAPGPHEAPRQMPLFDTGDRRLREELRKLDVTRLTPLDALNLLHRLSEEAKR